MKHAIFFRILLGFVVVVAGCGRSGGLGGSDGTAVDTVRQDNQLIMGLLYQQRAAEYRALCLQCYNLARLRLDEVLAVKKNYSDTPFAIVTDLDETAIDNSGNEARLYLHDSAYSPGEFDSWSANGQAGAVPGSVAFFNYVNGLRDLKKRPVTIYYISNRTNKPAIVAGTREQMRVLGFPQLVDSQFMFKDGGSSKEMRRLRVGAHHKIVLLLGDNLIDLYKGFDGTVGSPEVRMALVDSLAAAWGGKYIVFPNAEYGDWEAALYPGGSYDTLGKEQRYRIGQLKPVDLK